jgi:hypothetical protein
MRTIGTRSVQLDVTERGALRDELVQLFGAGEASPAPADIDAAGDDAGAGG